MKKNRKVLAFVLAGMLAAAAVLGGCGVQAGKIDHIGEKRARDIALEVSGLTQEALGSQAVQLKSHEGIDYYQVTFTCDGEIFEYDIDALTGKVIEQREPWSTQGDPAGKPDLDDDRDDQDDRDDDRDDQDDRDDDRDDRNNSQAQNKLPAAEEQPAAVQKPAQANGISLEEAKAIALAHAGVAADKATFVELEVDWDDGRKIYEIEFYSADHMEYDYKIDAKTGKILEWDLDAEGYTPPAKKSGEISPEEAIAKVLAKVPGATKDNIWEFEVDHDDGRIEYEGTLVFEGMEYEFEIDGYSGAFRDWEAEPLDD